MISINCRNLKHFDCVDLELKGLIMTAAHTHISDSHYHINERVVSVELTSITQSSEMELVSERKTKLCNTILCLCVKSNNSAQLCFFFLPLHKRIIFLICVCGERESQVTYFFLSVSTDINHSQINVVFNWIVRCDSTTCWFTQQQY